MCCVLVRTIPTSLTRYRQTERTSLLPALRLPCIRLYLSSGQTPLVLSATFEIRRAFSSPFNASIAAERSQLCLHIQTSQSHHSTSNTLPPQPPLLWPTSADCRSTQRFLEPPTSLTKQSRSGSWLDGATQVRSL